MTPDVMKNLGRSLGRDLAGELHLWIIRLAIVLFMAALILAAV